MSQIVNSHELGVDLNKTEVEKHPLKDAFTIFISIALITLIFGFGGLLLFIKNDIAKVQVNAMQENNKIHHSDL